MIIDLLQRLSIARPEECKEIVQSLIPNTYLFEKQYEFWVREDILYCEYRTIIVTGNAALDWLEGCVRRLIENTSDTEYHTSYLGKRLDRLCQLTHCTNNERDEPIVRKYESMASTLAEALLTAYLEYVEDSNG